MAVASMAVVNAWFESLAEGWARGVSRGAYARIPETGEGFFGQGVEDDHHAVGRISP